MQKSIDEHLLDKFGCDQYEAMNHATDNHNELAKSELCGCFYCGEVYKVFEIQKWVDDGKTACCPKCGLANVVIASSSGLPIENKEFMALLAAYWCG